MNNFQFKGFRNLAIGALQFGLAGTSSHPAIFVFAGVICFATSLGYFWQSLKLERKA